LNTIPFEVFNYQLVDRASNNFAKLPYLIHRYTIHYGYSIKLLIKNQERHQTLPPNIRCLAFAPPYTSNQPIALADARNNQVRNGLSTLSYTPQEIEGIAQNFRGTFESSANATEALFKAQSPDYGILHLAMHGEADFDNPKFGHLIFTNVGVDALEESLLYHYEIANLDLNAQLAVLSACETGVGKYEAGEGVFSLARSFMYAGVPSIVMSLWKVNDQSTSQIMPLFYQNLSKGMEKSRALRDAKLEYLETAELAYRHPFYWASFVALGDPQPLRLPTSLGYLFGIISLILMVGTGAYIWFRRGYKFNISNKR
jgi:CHAT domain-containing protein